MADGATPPQSERKSILPILMVAGLIALGIALQLAQYLSNRDLRLDEAQFALNLMHRSHLELLGPMDDSQNSPLLFMMILKSFLVFAGYSEYALRFIPLLSAILSLPLLYGLACCIATRGTSAQSTSILRSPVPVAAIIALAFYAVNKHMLFFSSDLRQYATNLLVACVLYLYVARPAASPISDTPSRRFLVGLLVLGAVSVWISIAAIFIVGGIGATYLLYSILHRNAAMIKWSTAICAVWVASFFVHYAILNSNIEARDLRGEMTIEQSVSTAPIPPTSFADFKWYRETAEKSMYFPLGLTYRGLGLFALLAGSIALWNRNRPIFLMLIVPVALALIASSLEKYPFKDRYLLFLLPALVLLLGEGIGLLIAQRDKTIRAVGVAFFILLYIQPFAHGLRHFVEPRKVAEITPLLAHITEHWEDGSILYCTFYTGGQLLYYKERFNISDDMYIIEPRGPNLDSTQWDYRAEAIPDLYQQGDPYWVLIEHDSGPPIPTHIGEEDDYGVQLEVVQSDGITLYRYTRAE